MSDTFQCLLVFKDQDIKLVIQIKCYSTVTKTLCTFHSYLDICLKLKFLIAKPSCAYYMNELNEMFIGILLEYRIRFLNYSFVHFTHFHSNVFINTNRF